MQEISTLLNPQSILAGVAVGAESQIQQAPSADKTQFSDLLGLLISPETIESQVEASPDGLLEMATDSPQIGNNLPLEDPLITAEDSQQEVFLLTPFPVLPVTGDIKVDSAKNTFVPPPVVGEISGYQLKSLSVENTANSLKTPEVQVKANPETGFEKSISSAQFNSKAEIALIQLKENRFETDSSITKNVISEVQLAPAKDNSLLNNTAQVLSPMAQTSVNTENRASVVLNNHPQNPAFTPELGQKVSMMIAKDIKQAHMHLNPPELGPIDVRITFKKEEASVLFTAHHSVTRESLDAAIPRLREMIQNEGINLANVDVEQHQKQQQDPDNHSFAQESQNEAFTGKETLTNDLREINQLRYDVEISPYRVDSFA